MIFRSSGGAVRTVGRNVGFSPNTVEVSSQQYWHLGARPPVFWRVDQQGRKAFQEARDGLCKGMGAGKCWKHAKNKESRQPSPTIIQEGKPSQRVVGLGLDHWVGRWAFPAPPPLPGPPRLLTLHLGCDSGLELTPQRAGFTLPRNG